MNTGSSEENISLYAEALVQQNYPFRESRQAGSEKKMMLPFQLKKPSIVVPDQLTSENLGEEKTDKSANKWPLIKEKLQPRCHIHYYFDLSWCDARYSARKRHSVLDIFGVCYPPHQALNAKPKAAMWYRAIIS